MKRENFIKIIRLRSVWKINKRKGDYVLPAGVHLSEYLYYLVESQLDLDSLGINDNGDIVHFFMYKDFDDKRKKIMNIVSEMIY